MGLVAHVLPNSVVPVAVQWMAICFSAVGGVGILRCRRPILEAASWSTFLVGATACLVIVGIAMTVPQPPGYSIALAVTPQVTSQVSVTVCARNPDGTSATTPDGNHVLAVLVDGVQVTTQQTSRFSVILPRGRHALRVELLTSEHREFSPAVMADATVTVTGVAPMAGWSACPSR